MTVTSLYWLLLNVPLVLGRLTSCRCNIGGQMPMHMVAAWFAALVCGFYGFLIECVVCWRLLRRRNDAIWGIQYKSFQEVNIKGAVEALFCFLELSDLVHFGFSVKVWDGTTFSGWGNLLRCNPWARLELPPPGGAAHHQHDIDVVEIFTTTDD